jgi:hypothetical protein
MNKDADFYNYFKSINPEVFFFSETWCSAQEINTIFSRFFPNYDSYGVDATPST